MTVAETDPFDPRYEGNYSNSFGGQQAERSISDGHHDSDRSTDPDPIVAERNAFKEKLKSINFGRVPGGARD